jgi:hypothetical protein
MGTIIFILFLLLTIAAITSQLAKRPKRRLTDQEIFRRFPSSQFDGLFAEKRAEEVRALAEEEARLGEIAVRRRLLERAAAGELEALDKAQAFGDAQFYQEVLRTISIQADGNPEILQSIVRHIVDSQELRSGSEFADAMAAFWIKSPDRYSLADALHLAALADDAAVFQRTIEMASKLWREGRIEKVSAENFLATVESAYWLIASEVRNSGSGFLLKQAIADVRRQLAAANRRSA